LKLFSSENLARFTRPQAALIHLGLSALVAATIVAVMLLFWYPSPYFAAAGGATLLMLLIGVDVVLGPLLTFVVFDPAKRSLVYDLAAIAMLQIAALIYGIHVMAAARPAFIVYLRGGFDVVSANDLVTEGMAEAKLPEFRSVPFNGPRLAATRIPVDPGLQLKISMETMAGGPDLTAYPRYYIPYATASREAAASGRPLASLAQASPDNAAAVAKLVASSGKAMDDLVYLPLHARAAPMSIVLDKAKGDVVGVLRLDPR
jgi:hypothetical protein